MFLLKLRKLTLLKEYIESKDFKFNLNIYIFILIFNRFFMLYTVKCNISIYQFTDFNLPN